MADFDSVRQTIDASIKQNGTGAITGPVLNGVLNEIVDAADDQVSQLGLLVGTEALVYSPYLTANGIMGSAYVGAYPLIDKQSILRGRRIMGISLNVARVGTLSIVKATDVGTTSFAYEVIKAFTLSSLGVQNLIFDTPVILGDTEWIGLGISSDTARWYISSSARDGGIPFYVRDSSNNWSIYGWDLQIAILTIPELPNIVTSQDNHNVNLIASDALSKGTFDSVPSNYGIGAYVADIWQRQIRHQRLTAIYLNIGQIGTLSVVKATNVSVNPASQYDTLIKTFTLTSLGVTRLEFDEPIVLGEDEWLGVGISGDTAKWKIEYPVVSTNPMNFWQKSGSSWTLVAANMCAGFEVEFWYDYLRRRIAGKKITIIGDSISSYSGTLPTSTFVAKYPANDVTNLSQMWWKQVIDALGLTLEYNNSWDGSPVSTDLGVANRSATSAYRLGYIGNPDIVVIFMGTNDWGHRNKTLGEFAPASGDTLDKSVFTQAYQYLIEQIQTIAPQAKIICCTPLQRGDTDYTPQYFTIRNQHYLYEFRDAIRKVAKVYGCEICDLSSCGITYYNSRQSLSSPLYMYDGLHPNRKGMNLIADKVIETILEM